MYFLFLYYYNSLAHHYTGTSLRIVFIECPRTERMMNQFPLPIFYPTCEMDRTDFYKWQPQFLLLDLNWTSSNLIVILISKP